MNGTIDGVAVIGMAGRFPDAANVDELWALLIAGYDGITRFKPDELSPSIPAELRSNPNYVAARGVVADADRFDATFFGISAREALLMDPQQRLLLELSWNALEHAGVDPARYAGSIGVYAGVSNNGYRKLVDARPDLIEASGEFAAMLANEKDYVATRIAHRLGLNGPAISIHTACSTSLVAIAQAWYALMSWQCDLALAGGINLVVPQQSGYLPVDGGMESGDGVCRPYDNAANGTIFSSGGGVVALKRLADAQADGDTIFAVIRGVGVNNDGSDKASFTAPSVRGQSAAIRLALSSAGVSAGSIGYVEGHGTGTALGDPIEVDALSRAFREDTEARQYCWLGSLKGNFGHLVAGSGVAGFIKAALALHHGRIPPTLHFREPNPEIDFTRSPFRVADHAIEWPRGAQPRRAGVSSFGVGGTNAHVVLEEAPPASAASPGRPVNLLPISARDEAALERRVGELSSALEGFTGNDLPDLAYTLSVGRRAFEWRSHIVAASVDEARDALARLATQRREKASAAPSLVFLFPGQGSQHANMARTLLDSEPVFRSAFDEVCQIASPLLGRSLVAMIHPAAGEEEEADALLAQTRHAQPALFAVSWALAQWWRSLGIEPDQLIGHSIGEYVAATLAGVFSLEDAVRLVVARGAAMQSQPAGAMTAVQAAADDIAALLDEGVSIAAYNAPELTVIAGPAEAIKTSVAKLDARGIASTALHVSHAFHSASMDGALVPFRKALEQVALHAPKRTFLSCVSGKPLDPAEAVSIDYWCRQLREPVRFVDMVREVAGEDTVFLEVGPGQALTSLVRRIDKRRSRAVPSLAAASARRVDDLRMLLDAVGAVHARGIDPDWAALYAGQQRSKRALPAYPFLGERYWIDTAETGTSPQAHTLTVPASAPMIQVAAAPTSTGAKTAVIADRKPRLAAALRELFENLSGESIAADQQQTAFLELGIDSLALTQAALSLERRYGVKVKLRRLMEDLSTIDALTVLLDSELPADSAPQATAGAAIPDVPVARDATTASSPELAQLIQNHLALLQQQSALLASLATGTPAVAATPTRPAITSPTTPSMDGERQTADLRAQPFGASARIVTERRSEFSNAQQQWIDDFIARYNERTVRSKTFSQAHRRRMADPRVVTGFNPLWKELVYPIVVERSHGACLWDIDGNEYIDLLNAFGANYLGYQPDYIAKALKRQIDAGMEIGPQHPLTAEVAELIGEMTGMARVAFCNTGSEAVMGAMRIARTVTGRDTIVIFTNSYHGIFDEVIVRGTRKLRSIAAAPGILASAVENVLVLDYGSDESLAIIRERASTLAAVMIEPVQGKNPALQPKAFVEALRGICDDAGCALIFDEVITGFRVAPGGAQEYYGIRADIATYGKVIGGGLPLAAIAGDARWLDALDGGHWQFGDDSIPEAGVTYFAGTFVRHPLALAAGRAALLHLKQSGPRLQRDINARTSGLVDKLNRLFQLHGAPLRAVSFASLWRILVDEDQPFASLFWYALRERGLHVYEQFNCFLTEAHGDSEVRDIVDRVGATVRQLLAAGMLTPRGSRIDAATDAASATSGGAEAPFALTEAQLDKWLACQYGDEANTAYNESVLLQLDGDLDVDALARAFAMIVDRHEALRLRFAEDGRSQMIDVDARVGLDTVDLSGVDADRALASHCAMQMARPFDLTRAPLLRAQLVRLDARRHALLLVGHHLVFDGWSASVLLDELSRTYAANVGGQPASLDPAESFRDYVTGEQARRRDNDADSDIAFWQSALAELPAPLALPGDRPRPRHPDYAATTAFHAIGPELTAALRDHARRNGVTLYSLLLHGFAALLAELSGQHDFVIGIPFAGQALAGSGSLLGDGVDMLPLRIDTSADVPVGDTHRRLLDIADHQDIGLGALVRAGKLSPASTQARVVFNLNPRVPALHFPGLRHALRDCPKTALFWDLFVNLNETSEGLGIDLHYATSLFDAATVATWLQRYEAMLAGLAGIGFIREQPANADGIDASASSRDDEPLPSSDVIDAIIAASTSGTAGSTIERITPASALGLSSPNDLQLHGATRPISPVDNAPALIAAQAEATPLRIAVECGERRLTYAGLVQRVDALAALLIDRGVTRGDLVGIFLPRGIELAVAVLAVQRAAAAYVPLDPNYPVERLLDIADQARLRAVITLDATQVPLGIADEGAIIAIDRVDLRNAPDVGLPAVRGDDLAYVLFTSGSTGRPKGVRVHQRNLVNLLTSMAIEPGIDQDDALVAVTTLSFDIAGLELHLPLLRGARVVIASDEEVSDPHALAALIRECDVSVMQTTPTLLRLLVDGAGDEAIRGLKLLAGGEALPPDLARRVLVHASELWNMYGPTETTIWSTTQRIHQVDVPLSLGHPIANTSISIVDEHGVAVAEGECGEIVIGGDGVADGYLGRDDLTAACFVADPSGDDGARRYRTGDIGSIRDGRLYYHGRADHQIKLRGHRIELGEVETTALQHPASREAVAIARTWSEGDQRLLLFVSLRQADSATTATLRDAIRDHLRSRLPAYMLPNQIIVLDALPRTPNGKIDRNALPTPEAMIEASDLPADETIDLDPREAWLATLWCELIGENRIVGSDNFFELGGHSLLAVEMATRVQKETGVRFNLLMIATGTLASLAAKLPPIGDGPVKQSTMGRVLNLLGLGRPDR